MPTYNHLYEVFPLDSYIILYRVIANGIEIVRVVSGYRNLKSLFSESDDD
jgi:toxin ParE1/3/4